MSYFAEQLKALRAASGKSMQELAELADVSKSMICKIEHDDVQPTIDVANRLARALGKPLSEMLHAVQQGRVMVLPAKEQSVWEDAQGIKRHNISPVFEGLKTEWLHVTLPPKQTTIKCHAMSPHISEKIVLVIKGTIEVKINLNTYKLNKGDSIYLDAADEHTFTNIGKESAEFHVVVRRA